VNCGDEAADRSVAAFAVGGSDEPTAIHGT
jgi:hypothetical protein